MKDYCQVCDTETVVKIRVYREEIDYIDMVVLSLKCSICGFVEEHATKPEFFVLSGEIREDNK